MNHELNCNDLCCSYIPSPTCVSLYNIFDQFALVAVDAKSLFVTVAISNISLDISIILRYDYIMVQLNPSCSIDCGSLH